MAILKRFEIWLLLILVVAVIVFATKTEDSVEEKPLVETKVQEPDPEPPVTASGKIPKVSPVNPDPQADAAPDNSVAEVAGTLRIDKVEVIPTQEGSIVDLTLSGRSGEEGPVSLSKETLRVTTQEGDEVSRFFLPFEKDPELDPDRDSLVSVKYWIPSGTDSLWVMYRDQKLKAELSR